MWRDLIRKDKLRGIWHLALFLALTLLAQNTVFARFRLWDVRVCILPALVVAVAMFHGPVWGGVFGLFAGFFGDMGYPESTILFLALLPVLGYVGGMLSEHLVNRGLLPFLCLCFGALLLTGFCQMFRLWVLRGADFGPLVSTAFRQAVVSLPFSIPFYFISKSANRRARSV